MLSGISKALLIQFWVPEQILLNKDNLTERLLEDESWKKLSPHQSLH